ncbi:MAG: hypothetical protein J4F35_22495 [Candidatus Latescibacteria bacterium]|nr:hypothetical protein [Candidatus Latescibacterota bacterium]
MTKLLAVEPWKSIRPSSGLCQVMRAGPVGFVVVGVGDAAVPGAEAVAVFEEHGVGEAAFFPRMVDAHCGVAARGLVEDLAGVL